jgi:DNA repair protein RecN (Recombination protein N)
VLVELSISRLALIESLRLQFGEGFHVFTGETGAGKSIVLDAIGLLLGNRASVQWIRSGADDALVEALFFLPPDGAVDVKNRLREYGVEIEGEQLVVSRQLFQNGRTVCRVNGRFVTVQLLKDIGELLVQQHGQHDFQGLLKAEEQLRLLDLYGKHNALLEEVHRSYHSYQNAQEAMTKAQMDEQTRMRRLDMLTFQIDEIEAASLLTGEEEGLREERKRLQYVDKIAQATTLAIRYLEGPNEEAGALSLLTEAASEVASALVHDEQFREVSQLLDSAQVYADEALRALNKSFGKLDANPDRLSTLDDRLVVIRTLTRKYGPDIADVLEHYRQAQEEKNALLRHEEEAEKLQVAVQATLTLLTEQANVLHERRVKAAAQLSKDVVSVLHELNMPNAVFTIAVDLRSTSSGKPQIGPSGADSVTFQFAANKGEEPKSIHKIASGGELSRTLLAIKTVLAEVDQLDTLIFDEIDTGVSGATTLKIAEQLVKLGSVRQVLCVTHSAQIAAAGVRHYLIEKTEREVDTVTSATCLTDGERSVEIARLLGSDVADATALHHAQALLGRFHDRFIYTS